MLDRRTPPPYQTIQKVELIEAEKQFLDNQIPLHVLCAGEQEILRIELVFEGGNSTESRNGISYFMTKMLGEGTRQRSSADIMEYIDGLGAFIEFNHGTDRISISIYTLSKYLAQLLPLLQELITEAIFPDKELENLKNVTLQNIRVNEEKNNYVAGKKFRELLFGSQHPYGRSIQEETIKQIVQEEVIQHFQRTIQNRPFEVFLVGKVGQKEVNLVNQFLGKHTVQKADFSPSIGEWMTYREPQHFFRKEGSLQSSIRIGRQLFKKNHEDYFKMTITNEVFGGYFGSRLMKNIREQKGFTYGIYSSLSMLKNAGYMSIGTDVKKDFTQATIDEIHKEAHILKTELVQVSELEMVRNYMLGSFAGSLNTPFDLGEIYKAIYFHDLSYNFYQQYIQAIHQITPEDILQTAQKYFNTEEMLRVIVGETS